MGNSICSCARKATNQNGDEECNLDRSAASIIKINNPNYEDLSSTMDFKNTLDDKVKNNMDKISIFNENMENYKSLNLENEKDSVKEDDPQLNVIIDNESDREDAIDMRYLIGDPVDVAEGKYEMKKVLKIQRMYRKFRESKMKIQQNYRTRGSLISFAKKNSIRSRLSFSSSFMSSQLGEMDDRLKGIIQQLKKPYKLRTAKTSTKGEKEGFCIQEWEDGSKLKGMFKNNKLNGYAQVSSSDGKHIEGEFSDNRVNGFARLINSTGTLYEGMWENGNINGLCRECWKDGTIFQGEYKEGRRNGIGIYRLPDGTFYEGSFVNDSLEGWGVMYFSNENHYSGEWKDDKMHGYGEYYWHNGRVYIGMWERDLKQGFGIHYWNNPEKAFIGFWKNNKQHGLGCVITPKLLKYGIWEHGDRKRWLKEHETIKHFNSSDVYVYRHIFPKNKLEANNLLKSMK